MVGRERRSPLISALSALEFAAVISRQTRMNVLSEHDARRTLAIFDIWSSTETSTLTIEERDWINAQALVRNFETKLAAPDAVHLAVAARVSAPIVTFDGRLAEAARIHGVDVVIPL